MTHNGNTLKKFLPPTLLSNWAGMVLETEDWNIMEWMNQRPSFTLCFNNSYTSKLNELAIRRAGSVLVSSQLFVWELFALSLESVLFLQFEMKMKISLKKETGMEAKERKGKKFIHSR